jgi:hypothetical protein
MSGGQGFSLFTFHFSIFFFLVCFFFIYFFYFYKTKYQIQRLLHNTRLMECKFQVARAACEATANALARQPPMCA